MLPFIFFLIFNLEKSNLVALQKMYLIVYIFSCIFTLPVSSLQELTTRSSGNSQMMRLLAAVLGQRERDVWKQRGVQQRKRALRNSVIAGSCNCSVTWWFLGGKEIQPGTAFIFVCNFYIFMWKMCIFSAPLYPFNQVPTEVERTVGQQTYLSFSLQKGTEHANIPLFKRLWGGWFCFKYRIYLV